MPPTAETRTALSPAEQDSQTPRRRGRWLRRFPLIIGLLSLTVWLLPSIIATTPLRNVVVNMAQSQLPKGVTVGSARLSWTETVQLNDVRVEDQQGREVLHVERIESEETLWELARQRMNQGLFHFFRPRLTLVVRERSTAIDPAVLRTLQKQQQSLASGSGRRGISFDLANGELALVDKDGNLLTELTDIEINFHNPANAEEGGRLHVTGLVSQPETGGTVTIEADWSGRTPLTSSGHVEARLVKVPVDALNPRIRARVDDRRLSGDVSCVLTAEWTPAGEQQVHASARLDASDIQLNLTPTAGQTPATEWSLHDAVLQCEALINGPGEVQFERLALESQPLSGSVTGVISRRDGELLVDLEGELASDPGLFLDLLQDDYRRYVAIEGLTASRIEVTGPVPLAGRHAAREAGDAELVRPATVGQADVGWNTLTLAGVRSDHGRVQAMWQDGRIVLSPQSITLGGGRVLTLPWVDLTAQPRSLVLDPGPVVENVQFTPDMTRTWLQYASPLMADATAIDGRFSVASQGARIPLAPADDEIRGTLQIHGAQVGPGPAAARMLGVVEQVQALVKGVLPNPFGARPGGNRQWLVLNEQSVQVRIADNRVHHDRIEYALGDAVLTSSGSVGYDESLDLVLDIPLQDRWLGGNLKSLRGESLRIPVTGTLDAPVIDPRPLTEFNRRIAGKAADGLLQKLLGQ